MVTKSKNGGGILSNTHKKIILAFIFGILVSGTSVYAVTKYKSSDITYKNTNVENALNELYNNKSEIKIENLKLVKGTNKINAIIGKKYLIAINVTSYSTQNYKPSIVSGCKILKENDMVSTVYDTLATHMKSYIVEATSDEIILQGNTVTSQWDHITYYEF